MSYDAVIVGSGPNGLAAAITLARAGRSVLVLEAKETIGGGLRTMQLTLPGFHHDVCSAIHPMGVGSAFMRSLPLEQFGVEWIHPPAAMAHPFDDGPAVVLERSIEATAERLGRDARSYARLFEPLTRRWEALLEDLLAPPRLPRHPLLMARFGLDGVRSAYQLALTRFAERATRGYFAGLAAHSMLPLERPTTAAFAMVLATLGHAVGWPFPKGGSQRIADGLADYARSLGCEFRTGIEVKSMAEIPPARMVFFDVTPRQLLEILGDRLHGSYRRRLEHYRYGPGVFKLDLALDGPIPWRDADCARTATVHLGGTLEEVAKSERAMVSAAPAQRPFVLVAQHSLFDDSRAPDGKQTVWAYCHVPHGSDVDMSERIERQIERFAPGFRDRILARHAMSAVAMQRYNPNYIGGDINGGVQDIGQLFTRPVPRWNPYSTPVDGVFICSSSTPPGGGVHGMCGYHAARSVM